MRPANPRVDAEPAVPVSMSTDSVDGSALSGWPLHPKERRDFYHRVHAFPPDVAEWRENLVRCIAAKPGPFQGVSPGGAVEDLRDRLDEGIAYIREIARILALRYGHGPS